MPETVTVTTLVGTSRYGQRKARLISLDGTAYTFLHVPPEVEHLDQNLDYERVERPGTFDLVEQRGPGLAGLRLSWLLGFPDPKLSIVERLAQLKAMCRKGQVMRFDYGPNEQGWWVCVDLSWSTKQRNLLQEETRAEVRLELRRAVSPSGGALVDRVATVAA